MIQYNKEHVLFNENKFYTEVWLKYASKVRHPEDVYDYMLELKIGTKFASTFEQIAKYFEYELLDYKKADKIYRIG